MRRELHRALGSAWRRLAPPEASVLRRTKQHPRLDEWAGAPRRGYGHIECRWATGDWRLATGGWRLAMGDGRRRQRAAGSSGTAARWWRFAAWRSWALALWAAPKRGHRRGAAGGGFSGAAAERGSAAAARQRGMAASSSCCTLAAAVLEVGARDADCTATGVRTPRARYAERANDVSEQAGVRDRDRGRQRACTA